MDSDELVGWTAFYRIEPFGPIANNINSAKLSATMANAFRKPKTKAVSVEDMAIGDITERPQLTQDADAIKSIMMGLVDSTKEA